MTNEVKENGGPDLKPIIRLLTWFTACYLFQLAVYEGSSQGIWFWFQAQIRPAWSLPVWFFTPTWTILYGLIAWASWQIWNSPADPKRTLALRLFAAQLLLNVTWPWLFYAWHKTGVASTEMVLLWVTAVATTTCFWRVKPVAGRLMIPFALWIFYLAVLNVVVWKLNR